MKTGRRTFGGVAVSLVLAALIVATVRAADDRSWATAEALGDVAVSSDGTVQFYANAGTQLGSLTFASTTSGGLAFDNSLNLFVTNTDTTASPPANRNHVVQFSEDSTHASSNILTQPSPRSLAFAGDNTLYVASPGSPATVRRYAYNSATGQFSQSAQFTVPTDSTACIGIDLAPDQSTLYYVSGGRSVRTVANANTATGTQTATPLPSSLPNPGTACGIRLLPPVDARCVDPNEPHPPGECLATPTNSPIGVGGAVVADARNIKRLDSTGAVRETFNAGSGPDTQRNWVDVALDPNRQDFWGVDAGTVWQLAKFRIKGTNQGLPIPLASAPRGVAVNGELRAAQTVRIATVSNQLTTVSFLEGTSSKHSWAGKVPTSAKFAVQAMEVRYDASGTVATPCAPSLDIRCRLQFFDSPTGNPTPKTYSRGRSVFYREILRESVNLPCNFGTPGDQCLDVGIFFPGPTDLSAGTACVVGGTPPRGTALFRSPWPHGLFTFDGTLVFYGGDDGGVTRTKTNDTIVVDRGDVRYYGRLIMPTPLTVVQIGSTLNVALEVRDPQNACNTVPGLNEPNQLVLSVTDITAGEDKGKIIGDSENLFGSLTSTGLTWASTANQYRTNLLVDSRYTKDHTYRLCVAAPDGKTPDSLVPAIGELCADWIAKVGSKKK
jgi:hypothetical protein